VVLLLATGQASANIVYTFSGVTFSDGGTLTGTFTTNDTFNALLDFDITTSPGAGLGFTYTPLTAGSSSTSLPFIIVLSTAAMDEILQVTFAGGLTATGAPITIGTFDSFEQSRLERRDIVAGSAIVAPVTVPEPSTLVLLATTGVLGVLTSLRRRRQA
ncbi:MAG: PEP-CTERM sorting domain-containing protein, partial [Vicinamibacterales bacterium]